MQHLRDWKVWEFSIYLTLNNTALYAFSYFLPVILKEGFGYSTGKAQLMTFPPYAVGACWLMACGVFGDHFKVRGPILVFNALLYVIGVSMTGYATNTNTRYGGVFLGVIGIIGNVPTQWAYQHNNMVGQTKKALTMAMMVMGGAFGGIISGNVFQTKEAPGYRSGLWIGIAFQVSSVQASPNRKTQCLRISRSPTLHSSQRTFSSSTIRTSEQIAGKSLSRASRALDTPIELATFWERVDNLYRIRQGRI